MKLVIITALAVWLLAPSVAAQHLGNQRPAKNDSHVLQNQVFGNRQGGDTVVDATIIPAVPYSISGATCGYNDDYDEVCPYTGSTSPDVVYVFHATGHHIVDLDLCGSSYDTKLYVYDEGLELVACNDDYYFDDICGVYVSRLDNVYFEPGNTYFIVIDGYGGDCGEYQFDIHTHSVPPPVDCPTNGVLEGEPPLQDDYEDAHNGGCNSPQFGNPMQELYGQGEGSMVFCGVSGWYDYQDSSFRDTDWFVCYADAAGLITWDFIAQLTTTLYRLGPTDCDGVTVVQSVTTGPHNPVVMTIEAESFEMVWLWVGPDAFDPPGGWQGNEYEYVFTLSGILDEPVEVQEVTWSGVKAMYR